MCYVFNSYLPRSDGGHNLFTHISYINVDAD
jgi:hypothetical protein